MHKPVKKAVFPVGGLGTRFLPATKAMPKEMLTVVDRPLIHYAFDQARAAGIEDFIFITGRNKSAIEDYFDHAYELEHTLKTRGKDDMLARATEWMPPPGHIAFIRQREPLGLGHAIYCAKEYVGNEPFAVLLADELMLAEEPFFKKMMQAYQAHGGNVISIAEVAQEDVSKYGIIDPDGEVDGNIKIKGMVEKPASEDAPSNLSITGQYILQPEIFDYLSKRIDSGGEGHAKEYQLTDALSDLVETLPTIGVPFVGQRYDCGNPYGFIEANLAFALQHEELRERVLELMQRFSKKEAA